MRSVGARAVHGLVASALEQAPTFKEIAASIAHLLAGRVPVAHNADFDERFLAQEMAQAGVSIAARTHWICMMQLAETCLPGSRSLAECCHAIGEPLKARELAKS